MNMTNTANDKLELTRAAAKIQATALAIVFGLICGLGLFGMTAWLLIMGGQNIGAHLSLLSNYFIGYSVTWPGSLIGLIYGTIVGGIVGWVIGKIYNRIAIMRQK